jgi:hypothetical protein
MHVHLIIYGIFRINQIISYKHSICTHVINIGGGRGRGVTGSRVPPSRFPPKGKCDGEKRKGEEGGRGQGQKEERSSEAVGEGRSLLAGGRK